MNRLKYILLGLVLGSTLVFGRTIVDTILKLGNGTDVDITIEAELGKGVANPALNYDSTNDKWQFCNEGDSCADMGSGGGGGGGLPLLGKGSLLTSNGVTNGEFTACADDELIVWDAAEVAGFKCEAKPLLPVCADNEILVYDSAELLGYRCAAEPSGGGAPLYETKQGLLNYDIGASGNTGFLTLAMPELTITVTAVSSKPISVQLVGVIQSQTNLSNTEWGCSVTILRSSAQPLVQLDPSPTINTKTATAGSQETEQSWPLVMDFTPVSAGDAITYTFTLRALRGRCLWASALNGASVLIQQGL